MISDGWVWTFAQHDAACLPFQLALHTGWGGGSAPCPTATRTILSLDGDGAYDHIYQNVMLKASAGYHWPTTASLLPTVAGRSRKCQVEPEVCARWIGTNLCWTCMPNVRAAHGGHKQTDSSFFVGGAQAKQRVWMTPGLGHGVAVYHAHPRGGKRLGPPAPRPPRAEAKGSRLPLPERGKSTRHREVTTFTSRHRKRTECRQQRRYHAKVLQIELKKVNQIGLQHTCQGECAYAGDIYHQNLCQIECH